jgi:hypothetical protein
LLGHFDLLPQNPQVTQHHLGTGCQAVSVSYLRVVRN